MKNNNETSSGKSTIISVLSFVLSLIMVLLTFVVVSHVTLFNDRGLFNKVSQTTYFSELNNEVVTRCQTIATKSGVDYEPVASVITSNKVDSDFAVYFNSISGKNPYAGRETINENKLADELYERIVKYDSDITDAEKASARRVALSIAKEYKETFILENFEKFIGFSEVFKSYSKYVFYILCALFLYLICVVVALNVKNQKHRLFRRFAIVGGSTGLTVLVLSLITKFSGIFQQITFATSQREYNLFMSFFDEFLNTSIIVGVSWLAVCIVLLVLWYLSVMGRIRK